jgi:hypothetical protein
MEQPTVSTFIREVATDTRDRVSLPVGGIRQLGWVPGDRLLVQRLDEDMVLLMRRPKKSTELGEETYEAAPDAETEAEQLDSGGDVALDPPEAALPDGQPAVSATAPLERLEQRIAALERLLANEPTTEAASPAEEPTESTMEDEGVGPDAAGLIEPPTDGMAEDEPTSEQAITEVESETEDEQRAGPVESAIEEGKTAGVEAGEIEEKDEQPDEEMVAEVPSPAEAEAEESEPIKGEAEDAEVNDAKGKDTAANVVAMEEAAGPVQEPAGATAAANESGDQTDGPSVAHDAVGAGVGAAAGVEAGPAGGVGAGLEAGVALRLFGDMLRQVLPEETMGHLEAGRREGLLALRALLAAGIERIDAMGDVGAAAKGATDGT